MDFNRLAPEWDSEPRIKRAETIAAQMKRSMSIRHNDKALDFGCGTGLISFNLHKEFRAIDLYDTSEEMIRVLNDKLSRSGISNMKAVQLDFFRSEELQPEYDVIYSSMVFHHIEDVPATLLNLFRLLNPGGRLCIVDLNPVSPDFHNGEQQFSGHHSFDPSYLESLLDDINFSNVSSSTFYQGSKKTENSSVPYSLFIVTAEKSSGGSSRI